MLDQPGTIRFRANISQEGQRAGDINERELDDQQHHPVRRQVEGSAEEPACHRRAEHLVGPECDRNAAAPLDGRVILREEERRGEGERGDTGSAGAIE